MIERKDGFFNDREEITHCRIGTSKQYMFEQVTSILKYGIQKKLCSVLEN